MKVVAYAITLYIFVISVVGLFGYIPRFSLDVEFLRDARVPLCLIGVVSMLLLSFRKRPFALLNIVWFLPQMLVISRRLSSAAGDVFVETVMFDVTIVVNFGFDIVRRLGSDSYQVIQPNIIGIAGLIVSIIIAEWAYRRGVQGKW